MAERTESSIRIVAEPAAILDVIADLPAYPQWSQGIKTVEVLESLDGRPVRARFELDAGFIKDKYELAYTWNGLDSVTWTLVEAEVLSVMDGEYELTTAPDGSTHVSYQLTVDLRIPMLGMLKRKAEQVIVDTALKGLKTRVETNGSHTR
ncbi:MAG: SRPBCC family protein [Actinomycetota bacterium]|nr:SRPBCC family protein [Actinomycetota bacterium]MDP2289034.1 SRPBCC family protein [Actinomycetota bacterium]